MKKKKDDKRGQPTILGKKKGKIGLLWGGQKGKESQQKKKGKASVTGKKMQQCTGGQ